MSEVPTFIAALAANSSAAPAPGPAPPEEDVVEAYSFNTGKVLCFGLLQQHTGAVSCVQDSCLAQVLAVVHVRLVDSFK